MGVEARGVVDGERAVGHVCATVLAAEGDCVGD